MEQFDFSNLHEKEKPSDIEQYFTKAQLENLSDYEKVRYRNMKKNYEMMVKMGLPALMPDFMQKRQKNKKMEEVSVPSDSDEEWKPFKPRAPKPKRGSLGKKQGLERVAKKNISYSDSDEDWEPNKERNKRRKVVKKDHNENGNEVVQSSTPEAQGEGDSKTNVQQKRRYPLRDVPTVTYMYLEVPDDDEFIYCEDCETEYEGDCPVHPSTRILDSKVSSNGENRAIETLPEGMSVRESSIPDAGLGVWTNRDIPCRSVFGPYEGEITKDAEKAHSTGYAWQVYVDGSPSHFVDAFNISKSNWMRYVNCARNEDEQNLVAYQHKGEIYYRSFKEIPSGTELLVWYGADYGKDLGIERLDVKSLLKPKFINGEAIYGCPMCKYCFSDDRFLSKHLQFKHSTKLEWLLCPAPATVFYCYQCQLCKSTFPLKLMAKKHHSKTHGEDIKENILQIAMLSHQTNSHQQDNSNWSSILHSANSCLKISKPDKVDNCSVKDTSLHTCVICRKQLTNIFNLQLHLKQHVFDTHNYSGNVNMKNLLCKQKYKDNKHDQVNGSKSNRQVIVMSNTDDTCRKKFQMNDLCIKTPPKKQVLKKPYKCEVFSISHHLQAHMKTHTGDKPYKCDVCGKGFSDRENLQKHLRTHTGDKPYKCDVCSKGFNQSQNLQTHMRTHTGDKPYKCDVCSKGFNQSQHLQTHMRTHTGDKPYKCDVCSKGFNQSQHLQTHMRTHTGDKPYKCDVCSKGFSTSQRVQIHMRTHTGDKPYKCDACSKGFIQNGDLQRHMRTHSGDKPYKCDVCSKGFNQSQSVQIHMRTHTGDKPYKCDVCSKGFSTSQRVQIHMRTHTGDKPYKCDACSKGFIQNGDLQRHMRTHSGDKPYKCDVCSKGFNQSQSVQIHMRTHTGDKPYKCDVCGKGYSDRSAYRKHLQHAHIVG